MDMFDRTWQGTEPLLFVTWNLTQLYAQKVCFCQLVVFALVNNNLCGHVRIEIPSHPLFPLWIAHPNSIKTRNPTPACNCKSRFQPVFSSNAKYHGPKKSNPTSCQTYWGPSSIAGDVQKENDSCYELNYAFLLYDIAVFFFFRLSIRLVLIAYSEYDASLAL